MTAAAWAAPYAANAIIALCPKAAFAGDDGA